MESAHDYFSMPNSKNLEPAPNWGYRWTGALSHWATRTPPEMPIWYYPATALNQDEPSMPYYSNDSAMSPYLNPPSAASSAIPSPNIEAFPQDTGYPHIVTSHNPSSRASTRRSRKISRRVEIENVEDETMEDEDSDTYSWEPNSASSAPPTSSNHSHRSAQSVTEVSLRNAKRAHTVVEKNYRERLNDKIADLALYLFETSSDSRTKPSKSLVMTRAKERLKQLEARNKSLESEVVKLRQHIAILDHIVTSKGDSGPTPMNPE